MKKFSMVVVLLSLVAIVYGGDLRSYKFRGAVKTSADPVYMGGVIYDALLFSDFTADNAILNKNSVYEVEKTFNVELKKQLMEYGVSVYDFEIVAFSSSEKSSTVQTGTLDIDQVDEVKTVEYDVNLVEDAQVVLSGDIEYFQFNTDFDSSYAVVTLKLFNRDSGKVLWLSTLSGTCGGVIDYLSDALTHEPVDMSWEAMAEEVEIEVEGDIMSRIPEITLSINPQEVVVKDPTKMPKANINVTVDGAYETASWSVEIYDMENNIVKSYDGTGAIPAKTTWDLITDDDNVAEYAEYKVVVTVTDEIGNTVSSDLNMSISEAVEE